MSARRRGVALGTPSRDTRRRQSLRVTMCFEKSRRAAYGNQPILSSVAAWMGRGRLSRHRDTYVLKGWEPARVPPRRNRSRRLPRRTERRHSSAGEPFPPSRGSWPGRSNRHLPLKSTIPGDLRCRNRSGAARRGMEISTPSRCDHRYDAFLVISLVEEPPRPDSVPPRLRRMALQLANLRPEAKPLTQVPSDGSPQPADDLFVTCLRDRL